MTEGSPAISAASLVLTASTTNARLSVPDTTALWRHGLGLTTPHTHVTLWCLLAGATAGTVAMALSGVTAGIVAAVYGTAVLWLLHRRATRRRAAQRRRAALDGVALLAGDLRAGVSATEALMAAWPLLTGKPPGPVVGWLSTPSPLTVAARSDTCPDRGPVLRRLHTAWEYAEITGAPLAEVLDRLETELRAAWRVCRTAAGHAANARMTAALLALLPIMGVLLGQLLGVAPLAVLLHTPLGTLCVLGAMALQGIGIAWSNRLTRIDQGLWEAPPGDQAAWRDHARHAWRRGVAGERRRRLSLRDPRVVTAVSGPVLGYLLGQGIGLCVGIAAAVAGMVALRHLEPATVRACRSYAAAEMPFALDLLAAGMRAGASTERAVHALGQVLDGPVGQRLSHVARQLQLGASPAEAWRELQGTPGADRLIRFVTRAGDSGAALAATCGRLADDLRADRLLAVEATARRAGVLVVLPLGLCFLPAFMLAGLVPVVIAVLDTVVR